METKLQTSKNIKIERTPESDLKKVLNIIGVFIFAGLALTSVTNPMSAKYLKEFFSCSSEEVPLFITFC